VPTGGGENEYSEARIEIRVTYPEEPTLGVLGDDLLSIDRSIRGAAREARSPELRSPRSGWPSLAESARIQRATTNSPLEVVSAIVIGVMANFTTDAVRALVRRQLATRLGNRPRSRVRVRVGFAVEIDRTDETPEEEEWSWPDGPPSVSSDEVS
jgi:hypothetical protein